MEIELQPIGEIETAILQELSIKLIATFGCPVIIKNPIPVPQEAFVPDRNQYFSDAFLKRLQPAKNKETRILGITDVNLFTRGLNFVFGQADSTTGIAVISLHRLRQDICGLPSDQTLLLERALKEAVHELGHTFGMEHCEEERCVMFFSSSLVDTDLKNPYFCSHCQPKLSL
ncbi:MAG: archaemetzincin family Zn-dependent metalloprotease [Phycisphaerae bacterium]|nr:archaemetzincin family Zn-dependent metalloprotease [Phycisphaerae bacterium]